jgi:NAD(P)-dependent dehydrogenase (short-subunit alcohol dehydrogenase family)
MEIKRHALISGGASGLGRRRSVISVRGARVAILDFGRKRPAAGFVVGDRVLFSKTDVTDEKRLQAA